MNAVDLAEDLVEVQMEEESPPPSELKTTDYSIDIVNLCKSFERRTAARADYTTIKSSLIGLLFGKKSTKVTHTNAIDNLTMRVPTGTSMGIIGRNGSGKSTLLKLITGIYRPDKGDVSVNGRVAALIELGAGFHPDFTGRENLVLGGVLHGLSREQIDERFEEIVRFAELEHVIDDPVRTYSSGMFMRLGFSLAVHTDPDILLVDEVLAVGDAAFVSKCKERISELRRDGKTLLLVSHDLGAIERWCDEAIWLQEGVVADRGDPRRVIDAYRYFVEFGEEQELFEEARKQHEGEDSGDVQDADESADGGVHEEARWGSREVEITSVRLLGEDGRECLLFHPEEAARIEIDYCVNESVDEFVFGIGFHRTDGLSVHGSNTAIEKLSLPDLGKAGTLSYCIRAFTCLCCL